ncbi:hypothetical protein [Belnapia sp. F-4-1]|uniref:hypothetical protein n=1 Tax=Belnapia sp. F-4-1 TaxID=1545443 RepID=UPI00068EDE7F|nr:hypothetical protein [Belnapia sp. F-4-1]
MAERLTKAATRNIFYGGLAFFLVTFVTSTIHTHFCIAGTSAPVSAVSDGIVRSKEVLKPLGARCSIGSVKLRLGTPSPASQS